MSSVKQIFVTGSSRSGTTMLSRILNQHSKIISVQELHFFNSIYKDSKSKLEKKQAEYLLSKLLTINSEGLFVKSSNFNDLKAREILNQYNRLNSIDILKLFFQEILSKNNSNIICEHTPSNIFYIEEIFNLLPDSFILNMIRDPRDVMLSQKFKWKRRYLGAKNIPIYEAIRSYINYHPFLIAWFWNSSIIHYNKYENHKAVILIHFEKLLQNPEEILNNICKKLNIYFSNDMLKIPNIGSSTSSDTRSIGFDTSKIGRWESSALNSAEIYICQLICGSQMKKYGYKRKRFILPPLLLLFYIVSFPFHLFIAFMMNFKRSANIFRSIRKRLFIK